MLKPKESRNGSLSGNRKPHRLRQGQGTNVYNATGDSLGSIHDVMIDKRSGKVAYAIMPFGGFLGMGTSVIPCLGQS